MIPVEAIQRVKDDLERRRKVCTEHGSYNRAAAFETAIGILQEVIAQYAPDQIERGIDTGDSSEHRTNPTSKL